MDCIFVTLLLFSIVFCTVCLCALSCTYISTYIHAWIRGSDCEILRHNNSILVITYSVKLWRWKTLANSIGKKTLANLNED